MNKKLNIKLSFTNCNIYSIFLLVLILKQSLVEDYTQPPKEVNEEGKSALLANYY